MLTSLKLDNTSNREHLIDRLSNQVWGHVCDSARRYIHPKAESLVHEQVSRQIRISVVGGLWDTAGFQIYDQLEEDLNR